MTVYVHLTSSRDEEDVTFQERHLILVEGKDDRALLAAMIKHENLPGFQVHHMWGKSKWAAQVGVIVRQPEFQANVKTLGLVKDADEDPDAVWASCRDTLIRSSLPVPTAAVQLAEGHPSTAVMVIPSRDGRGALGFRKAKRSVRGADASGSRDSTGLNCFDRLRPPIPNTHRRSPAIGVTRTLRARILHTGQWLALRSR